MFFVVYDIRDSYRLNKVHKTCKKYGDSAQYSFFEADITKTQVEALKRELNGIIDSKKDRVFIIPMCKTCFSNVQILGEGKLKGEISEDIIVYY